MHRANCFAEESREEIVKSNVNNSTSKHLWTFYKERRFPEPRPNCPYIAYDHDTSTISQKKTKFGSAARRVFTEASEGPSASAYSPSFNRSISGVNGVTFGQSRNKCISNCYIPIGLARNPGPGHYADDSKSSKISYTMRPKTANNRTYFVDDKEQASKPSPLEYNPKTNRNDGKGTSSKFKSIVLGGVGLKTRYKRFKINADNTPSSWDYNPKARNLFKSENRGYKLGTDSRHTFVDHAIHTSYTPGPGNYKLPSDFGHYRQHSHSAAY